MTALSLKRINNMNTKKALKQLPSFAARTYRGGKVLREFLGEKEATDNFYPEDWISSFTEAKNKNYVENEGISRVITDGGELLITDVVSETDFGQERKESGVLIKLLDSAERLGIQVHPTKEYARKHFGTEYGKTECWYILKKRDENACVYLGFKENVTKEYFAELFKKQDVDGMLECMHKIYVNVGDVILVNGGTPHAIGAGCFLLEIQEPTDYTMRAEKTTVAGDVLTPMQIHYGVGEKAMLDCFDYTPRTIDEIKKCFVLKPKTNDNGTETLVSYEDTPCFKLELVKNACVTLKYEHFTTVVVTESYGILLCGGEKYCLKRGDRFFIPANIEFTLKGAVALICSPPQTEV